MIIDTNNVALTLPGVFDDPPLAGAVVVGPAPAVPPACASATPGVASAAASATVNRRPETIEVSCPRRPNTMASAVFIERPPSGFHWSEDEPPTHFESLRLTS